MSQRLLFRLVFRLLSLAAVFVTIGGRTAYARERTWIVPPCQAYWESTTVFVGTVRKIAAEAGSLPSVTFDVEQVERGPAAPTMTVRVPPSNLVIGGSPFVVGGRYVVYVHGRGDEAFVGSCGRTRLASERLLPGEYTLSLRAPERMLLDARLSSVYEHPAPGSFTVSLRYARGCMPISFTVRERGGIRGVLLDDRGAPSLTPASSGYPPTPTNEPLPVSSSGAMGGRRLTPYFAARGRAGESHPRRRRTLPRDAAVRRALYAPSRGPPRSERPHAREL